MIQEQLPGLEDGPAKLVKDVRLWVFLHREEWEFFKSFARSHQQGSRGASPNFCLQSMRNEFCCSIPNAYAPVLARIAMEQDRSIRFSINHSKVDEFVRVVLSK